MEGQSWQRKQKLMESYQKVNHVTRDLANHWILQMTDEEIERELTLRGIDIQPHIRRSKHD